MKQFRTLTTAILFAITLCCLPGCAAWFDPRQKELEPYVETNPSPQAIVGLWHHRHPSESTASTVLFRENGTGIWKPKGGGTVSFSYVYTGNGVWKRETNDGLNHTYKIAKGKLLQFAPAGNALVYDRQTIE